MARDTSTTDDPPSTAVVPEALFASTGFLLGLLGGESRRRWAQALERWNLRPSHFGALMVLGELGAASQRELGRMIGIDPRNLVPVIDVIEERGLAERTPDPMDRRRHVIRLTSSGKRLLRQLRRSGDEAEMEMLAALDVSERAALHALLLKLVPIATTNVE